MLDLNESAKFEIAKLRFGEEVAFRIRSRRNGLLGLWLARELGMPDEAAAAYARKFAALCVEHPSDAALARHITSIGARFGLLLDERAVRAEMERLTTIAALEHGTSGPPAAEAA